MPNYPMALRVTNRLCVVVGGGAVAERKVASLRRCDANLLVVSPALTPGLERLAAENAVTVARRAFEADDLADAVLVIAATDNRSVNDAVVEAARARGVLVNVVDAPEECDFYVPASIQRGGLQITVDTQGTCPALSKRLRRQLEAEFGPEYGDWVALAGELRTQLLAEVASPEKRKKALVDFLDSPALEALRDGRGEDAKNLSQACLNTARQGEEA
jgi:precorrin-2 dehydrogenase / sirohydrochlorin ferrochelatase